MNDGTQLTVQMLESRRSRRALVFLTGVGAIISLDALWIAVLLHRHPELWPKPTDEGDGLGLIVGFGFWIPLAFWFLCFWIYDRARPTEMAEGDREKGGSATK